MLRSIIFFFLSLSVLSLCTPAPVVQRSLSAADKQAYLSAHNNERAKFGAEALVWSDKLANAAASWANHCIFKHSGGTLGPFGENLAAGTDESPASAVGSWNKESSQFQKSNPQPSHFTQVVWKATKQVGCAHVSCAPGKIFPAKFGSAAFHVCEYFPQGNVIGAFGKNVQ